MAQWPAHRPVRACGLNLVIVHMLMLHLFCLLFHLVLMLMSLVHEGQAFLKCNMIFVKIIKSLYIYL